MRSSYPALLPGFALSPQYPRGNFRQQHHTSNMSNSTKLDRYKLDTIFSDGSVLNMTYRTDLATGERRTAVQTTWTDRRIIGSGGFSIVILQESAGGRSRAVKKLFKVMSNTNYAQELTVLLKVAEVCFGSFHSEDIPDTPSSTAGSFCRLPRLVRECRLRVHRHGIYPAR